MFDSLPPDPRMPPGIDDIDWYEAALLVLALEECDTTHHPFVVVEKRAGYRWESAAHMSSVLASRGIVLVEHGADFVRVQLAPRARSRLDRSTAAGRSLRTALMASAVARAPGGCWALLSVLGDD